MGTMEASEMFLVQRTNGVWYFRRPVPKNLQQFLNSGNKREINFSLKSKSLDAPTRRLHHDYLLESERLLEEAQKRADSVPARTPAVVMRNAPPDSIKLRSATDFSDPELDSIFQSWFLKSQTDTLENARFLFHHGDSLEREAALEAIEAKLRSLQRRLGAPASLTVMAQVRSLIESAGGVIPHLQKPDGMLKVAGFEAKIREGMIRQAVMEREILTTGILPKLESASLLPEPIPPPAAQRAKSITLNELISRFENDPSRSVTPKTRDEFQIVFQTLRELLGGESPMTSISREQIKDLQAICLALPAHFMRIYRGKTLREAATLAKKEGRPPMNPATFNKRMTLLGAVFAYAVREQIIVSSPALSLTVEVESKEPGAYSLTVEQLNRIFSGPIFTRFVEHKDARYCPGHALKPHLFWAPFIGLFQGLREEEILQLCPHHVEEKDGISCLQIGIKLKDGERIKVTKSKRSVPIHPTLIRLGFLRYVSAVRAAALPDLFPDATRGATYGNRSQNFSKRWSRYLTLVGVKISRDQIFHSFRHTFTDGLRTVGVREYAYGFLAGWSGQVRMSDRYGGRLSKVMFDELSKLAYEGLDLSHLEQI